MTVSKRPRKRRTKFNNKPVKDFGCRFRSKFEWRTARWLEKLGIKWEFEPRVRLQDSYVLPDFYLPDYNLFIELRPEKLIDEKLLKKIRLLKKIYGKEVCLATNIRGATTLLKKLDEHRQPSDPDVVWVFTDDRGKLHHNKRREVPVEDMTKGVTLCPVLS